MLIAGTVGIMFLCSGVNVNLWIKRFLLTSIVWAPALYFLGSYKLSQYQKHGFLFFDPFSLSAKGWISINKFVYWNCFGRAKW